MTQIPLILWHVHVSLSWIFNCTLVHFPFLPHLLLELPQREAKLAVLQAKLGAFWPQKKICLSHPPKPSKTLKDLLEWWTLEPDLS
jgi:hypothetical protein